MVALLDSCGPNCFTTSTSRISREVKSFRAALKGYDRARTPDKGTAAAAANAEARRRRMAEMIMNDVDKAVTKLASL